MTRAPGDGRVDVSRPGTAQQRAEVVSKVVVAPVRGGASGV